MLPSAVPLRATHRRGLANNSSPINDAAVSRRLANWRKNAAGNSDERFAARLEWDGLTPASATGVLGDDGPLTGEDDLWACSGVQLLSFLTRIKPIERDQYESLPADIPFAPVLAPLVAFAVEMLNRAIDPVIAPHAATLLQDALCDRLSEISHRALGAEFRRFRASLPHREGAWSAFERKMADGGLRELFERLPVLLRLIATAITFWVDETAAFLNRLHADRDAIGSFLLATGAAKEVVSIGPVDKINSFLSDPHRRGANVKIVRFASGAQIVYKPKNLAIDVAWWDLTKWFGEQVGVSLRSPRVLDRGNWGWAEFISHEPCADIAAVERFYRRAGALVCLLFITGSSDFHEGNLLASGEDPVPIDLETVLNPETHSASLRASPERSFRNVHSVVHLHMLPAWIECELQTDAADVTGLGAAPATQPEISGRIWVHPNTDAMEFVAHRRKRGQCNNAPFLADGTRPNPGNFLGQVTGGFVDAYSCLVANRAKLLGPDSPFEAFRTCRMRVVIRPTQLYDRVAKLALSPGCLTCGVDRSLEFEILSRAFLASKERDGDRAIFRSEVAALEHLDVPYFQAGTDSMDLLDACGNLVQENYIRRSGYQKLRQRLGSLSDGDCALQVELIRASFFARDFGSLDQPPLFLAPRQDTSVDQGTLLDTARGLARELVEKAIWEKGEASWVGLDALGRTGRLTVGPLGPTLYGGSPGLAVFLAAMFAIEGDLYYRETAVGVMRAWQRTFLGPEQDRQTRRITFLAGGIGAATGASSTIYGLLKTGQLLEDSETLETALNLSRLLDADAILADRRLDVTSGAAGAILSLLALWRQTDKPELLEKALLCGEHLIGPRGFGSRAEVHGSPAAWQSGSGRPLSGFSHGAAGIGFALLRLHAAAPDKRWLDAAREAFAYERTLFSPEHGNWADLRDDVQDRFGAGGWCHGAPGIALSRMAALPLVDDDTERAAIRLDLDAGLRFLTESKLRVDTTVCCGEMGCTDILLEASRYLGRPELEALARKRVSGAVTRIPPVVDRPFIPGFFQGSAGIGYGLLRIAAPDRLPCILLWE